MSKVHVVLQLIAGLWFSIVFLDNGRAQSAFIRSDSNTDGEIDVSDPVHTILGLFSGRVTLSCDDAADSNDDGTLDLSDAVYSLSYLYRGGPPPPAPGPIHCAPDPSDDGLDCALFEPCVAD